jgi:hypothetical protein
VGTLTLLKQLKQMIRRFWIPGVMAVLLTGSLSAPAQTAGFPTIGPGGNQGASPQAAIPNAPPSISLSPAVIMAKGALGQELTQTLTLTNNTALDLGFELVAEDVIIKDGKRVFVPAGETANSIAASAVFSARSVEVKGMAAPMLAKNTILIRAYSSGAADVRLTLPRQTNIRAVAVIFRGTDKLPTSSSSVGMTASLAALVTFNVSENVKLEPEPLRVIPASETANMTIAQWIANTGSEPALPEGTAAVLNSSGSLVGKTTFSAQRLLPGERLEFTAEYPEQLRPGDYRALCSFQFEGKTLTSDATFKVP